MGKRKREAYNEDRPRLRDGVVYNQVTSDTWIDVKDLCVHIHKSKQGVSVEIWHIDGDAPIDIADALYEPVVPVLPLMKRGVFRGKL